MNSIYKKSKRKICSQGHVFLKSSDCPTCPICEAMRKPKEGFLALLGAPAIRALEREQITSLEDLTRYTEVELLKLHGLGPSSIPKLKAALKNAGLFLKSDNAKD